METGFGEAIREWRQYRDISQVELAHMVGCSPSIVSKWETGERLPRVGAIKKQLHEVTGMDIDSLISCSKKGEA